MSAVCWMVTGGKYLLAKGVESAFEGNKDMLMRKTVESDERSPEKKNFHPSVYWEVSGREQKWISPKLQVRYSKYLFSPNTAEVMKTYMYRCIKLNVFPDASSYTSCHARRDNFTTSWKTDNRCPLSEMFMMSVSIDLPGAMRLTGSSQPISCPRFLFHYISLYWGVSMLRYLFSSSPLQQVVSRQLETDNTTSLQLLIKTVVFYFL